jgi:NitT/TauT family transport system ATP-binding protein
MTNAAEIELSGVGRSYAGRAVFRGLDLTIGSGELVVIVGPSGSGKTTLLHVLAGLVPPDEGTVRVGGQVLRGPSSDALCIFQEDANFPWLSVEQNVAFGARDPQSPDGRAFVAKCIAGVGLAGRERAFPRELSGGMRQRLQIARALAARPRVLFMDEPFGALDWLTRAQLRADLERIRAEQGLTIVFITHDLDEALQLGDRVVVLGGAPSTIQLDLRVDLPRPREPGGKDWLALRRRVLGCWQTAA